MSYTPPAWNQGKFAFGTGGYTPPAWNQGQFGFGAPPGNVLVLGWDSIGFGTAYIDYKNRTRQMVGWDSATFGTPAHVYNASLLPSGFATQAFGTAAIKNRNQYVSPAGFVPMTFGTAKIYLATLFPSGWNSMVFGTPTVYLHTRYVTPPGFTTYMGGTHLVWNYRQYVTCSPGIAQLAMGTQWASYFDRNLAPTWTATETYGVPFLSGGVRTVLGNGWSSPVFGTAFVSLSPRQVYPTWWVDTFYGRAMVSFSPIAASPSGWDSSAFGSPTFTRWPPPLFPSGWDSVGFSLGQRVSYLNQTIGMPGIGIEPNDYDRWSVPKIWTRTNYIKPAPYLAPQWITDSYGGPPFLTLVNHNRVVDLVGNGIPPVFRSVSPFHDVENKARIVKPVGLDPPDYVDGNLRRQLVAPRVRTYSLTGLNSFTFGSFAVVYNKARLLQPPGTRMDVWGMATLVNTRRYLTYCGLGIQSLFGTAFVAPRVRTIAQAGSPLAPAGGLIGGARVSFYNQPILPTQPPFGWGGFFGPVIVTGYPPLTIRVPGIPNDLYQVSQHATVQNRTPQLYPYWNADTFTLFGANAIHNQFTRYPMQGWVQQAFGLHFIDYRTKHLQPGGLNAFRPNNLHSVRNVNPDPPGRQYLIPSGIDMEAWGSPHPNQAAAWPTGWDSMTFGTYTIKIMSIFPKGIVPPADDTTNNQFGSPMLNATQYAFPDTIGMTDSYGTPDFQPRTIWAPTGASDQAVRCNPPGTSEYIDNFLMLAYNTFPMPVWGTTRVELKNRTLPPSQVGSTMAFGTPAIRVNPQYAVCTGFKSNKFGYQTLSGGDTGVQAFGSDVSSFGATVLTQLIPSPWYFGVSALQAGGPFGTTWVSNFHREMPVSGWLSQAFGTTWVQRPPPPAQPPGMDYSAFGAGTFIDYRIRHLGVEGDDMFTDDYTQGQFTLRLHVGARYQRGTYTLGDQHAFGAVSVDNGVRYLAPRSLLPEGGWMGLPKLRDVRTVAPAGAGVETFGDAWALPVTPGTIQPRGNDWLNPPDGIKVNRKLPASGFIDELLGTSRIAHLLGVNGSDEAQFGLATLIGTGCGARAVSVVGINTATFGTPAVA